MRRIGFVEKAQFVGAIGLALAFSSLADARPALRASRVYSENRSDDIYSYVVHRGEGLFVVTSLSSGENSHRFRISARNGEAYPLNLSQDNFSAFGPDDAPLKIVFRDDLSGDSENWTKMKSIGSRETVSAYFELERWDRTISGNGVRIMIKIRGGPTAFWFSRDRD